MTNYKGHINEPADAFAFGRAAPVRRSAPTGWPTPVPAAGRLPRPASGQPKDEARRRTPGNLPGRLGRPPLLPRVHQYRCVADRSNDLDLRYRCAVGPDRGNLVPRLR